jgi:hypothetical protein
MEKMEAKMSDQWNFGTRELGAVHSHTSHCFVSQEQESAGLPTTGDERDAVSHLASRSQMLRKHETID